MPNELARELARILGDDASLNQLILAAEAPPPQPLLADEVRTWATANRDRVLALVGSSLPPAPGLEAHLLAAGLSTDGWHPRVTVGPAVVGVDCVAATLIVDGTAVPIGLLPPTGATLSLDAGAVSGGGALTVRPDGASGSIAVQVGVIDVSAFADLAQAGSTPSLAIVLGARFTPAIQLSFGFGLSAVGGVIGVNRRLNTDALRARLADGSALDLLFPANPSASAATVMAGLSEVFTVQAGRHVLGPTMTITWLDLGPLGSVVSLDLGVLVSIPDARVVIVGRAAIQLPAILALRLDILGELDPGRSMVAIDAVLVDSHALGVFDVTGTAAVRLCWGQPPYLVATLGGFYPGFRPEPALLPPQQRLGLHLAVPCPLTLRAEGYLAITSNSVQVGALLEAGFDLAVIEAHGSLQFDAIVTFDPFHVHVDYASEWEVRVAIFKGGTTVSGWIDGPGPWTVHASVSISLLIDDFDWSDTFTFGSPGPPPAASIETICDALGPTLGLPSRLRATETDDPDVVIEPRPDALPAGTALASPLAELTWLQDQVPLNLDSTRVGGRRLSRRQSAHIAVDADVASVTGPALDWFAPAVFADLTRAEALSQPTYQHLEAGVHLRLAEDASPVVNGSVEFEEYFRRPGPAGWSASLFAKPHFAFHAATLQGVLDHGAPPVVSNRSALVEVRDEQWALTIPGGQAVLQPSAIHSLQAAKGTEAVFHPLNDAPIAVGAI